MDELLNTLLNANYGLNLASIYQNELCIPDADMTATKDEYTITVDLPGRTEEDLDISVKDKVLTIATVSKKDKERDKVKYLLKERSRDNFKRTFYLPKDASQEDVTAKLLNGVLTVTIKRCVKQEAKKICINVA